MKDVMWKNLNEIGAPAYTEEDNVFAREIQKNLGLEPLDETMYTEIVPPEKAYGDFHPADDVNEFTSSAGWKYP